MRLATRLEDAIPGARRGSKSHLPGYEALDVHFRDTKVGDALRDIDDKPANQCQRYRDGGASHFVELAPSYDQMLWTALKRKAAYLPG
jgi:hypothetical protein